jgi:hypothetical protein
LSEGKFSPITGRTFTATFFPTFMHSLEIRHNFSGHDTKTTQKWWKHALLRDRRISDRSTTTRDAGVSHTHRDQVLAHNVYYRPTVQWLAGRENNFFDFKLPTAYRAQRNT